MKNKITIVLPPTASSDIDLDLVNLTEFLSKKLKLDTSFGLGGEFGYGVDYENEVFMMHPFCWCERDDECLWCMMNDPEANKNYDKMKSELKSKFNPWWAKWGGAPNFFYKPTKRGCIWYKWIGRDTRWENYKDPSKKDWKEIYEACIKSIK